MCFGMFIGPLSFLFCVIPIQNFHQFLLWPRKNVICFNHCSVIQYIHYLLWCLNCSWFDQLLSAGFFVLCSHYALSTFSKKSVKAQFHQMLFYICLEILCIFPSLICYYKELHWLIFYVKRPCFYELSKTIYSWIHLLLFC